VFEVASGFVGGGPPIVGDFDNDGRPEVAQASRSSLTVYDIDCEVAGFGCTGGYVRWRKQSQDFSSSITGSALFQFLSSEAPMAVYADECFSRVYHGQTGEVMFSSFRSSCTWCENPIMANTNGITGTEIIIGSNDNCGIGCPTIDPEHYGLACNVATDCPTQANCVAGRCRCATDGDCDANTRCAASHADIGGANTCRAYHPPGAGVTGARIFTDNNGQWQDSEPIWNQHTYTVTNVYKNGTVPRTSAWLQNFKRGLGQQFNTYRANAPLCNSQSCVNGQCTGVNECKCDAGWTGLACIQANCTPPCQNFGYCIAPDRCDCRVSGFNTSRCEAPVTTGTTGRGFPVYTSTSGCTSNFSCDYYPDMCGTYDDGCGQQEFCGNCDNATKYSANWECDAFKQACVCVPITCTFPIPRLCGVNISDGCGGFLDSCGANSGVCSTPGDTCSGDGICQV
jgi:hypothetical protein